MSQGRFQHLVPQWYLRRFADKKKNIRRINKDGSVNELRRVKEIAGERDFYTFIEDGERHDAFEHALMGLDDAAANATRRIIKGQWPVPPSDRDALAFFLAIQIDRTFYMRAWLDQFVDWAFEEMDMGDVDFVSVPDVIAESGDFELVDGKVRVSRRTKLDMVVARSSLVAGHLHARPWRLLEFDSPVLFTGDQPVNFFVSGGLVATNAFEADEIRWPLSRRAALVLGPATAADGEHRRGSTAEADGLNGSTGDWAFEWTFDHPDGPTQTMYRKWIASTTAAQRATQKQLLRSRFPFDPGAAG